MLDTAAQSLIDVLNDDQDWPAELKAAVNTEEVLRQLRIASSWAGRCEVSAYLAGDGRTAVTIELTGLTGRVVLGVDVDEQAEQVQRAEVSLLPPR